MATIHGITIGDLSLVNKVQKFRNRVASLITNNFNYDISQDLKL